jgi:hypothetical protein
MCGAGRLRCLGSVQHLKAKFGQGYTLQTRVGGPEAAEELRAQLSSSCPGGVSLASRPGAGQPGVATFVLAGAGLDLAGVIEVVEAWCSSGQGGGDYSVTQATLENVFLRTAV